MQEISLQHPAHWRPCPPARPSSPRIARAQRGASRFEFGVVVVVAGVLLTLALSSLGPWQQRLRQWRLEQALSTVRAAVILHHARCVQSGTRPCIVTLPDGQRVADIHGYPAASEDGLVRAASLGSLEVKWRVWEQHGLPMLTVYVPSPAGEGCQFTYVQAPTWGAEPGIDHQRAPCP